GLLNPGTFRPVPNDGAGASSGHPGQEYILSPVNTPHIATNNAPPSIKSKATPSPPAANPGRVMLPSEDGVSDDGNGHYRIKLNLDGNKAGKHGDGTQSNDGKQPGDGQIHITPPDPGGNPPTGTGSTEYRAIANDLKLKGEYNRAIEM